MDSPAKRRKINKTEKSMKFFKFIGQQNGKDLYICAECSRTVNGSHTPNLVSHLKSHPSVYADLCSEDSSIEYKRKELLLNCVELIGVNGRPYKCLSDSAIHKMNQDVLDELKSAGRSLDLKGPNFDEVKNELKSIAQEIRGKIASEVKNRPISLLVDIVTKREKSILGVSIQYTLNKSVKVRSIGMIPLEEAHTGKYLANLIIKRLKELDIDLKQVISITTDNGANVLRMVVEIEMHLKSAINEAGQLSTPQKRVRRESHEIDEICPSEEKSTDDEALDSILKEADLDDNEPSEQQLNTNQVLLESIQLNMENDHGLDVLWSITGISCVVHTLQLAIGDSIKHLNQFMETCRKVAKILRKSSTIRELKIQGIDYKRPVIDMPTRWGSLYQMVSIHIDLYHISHIFELFLRFYTFDQLFIKLIFVRRCWVYFTAKMH